MKRIAGFVSIAAVLLSLVAVARAEKLKVLSAGTMHFALKDVDDNFTRKTGTKLAITFGSVGGIKTKFEKGAPADVVILPKPDIAALARAGKIAPDRYMTSRAQSCRLRCAKASRSRISVP